MATLPTQPIERAKAEVARLQARIDEALQAAASHDGPAVEAALLAYTTIVVEAAQGTLGDPVAIATIEASVELHLVVLTRMADAEPAGPARTAAMRAVTESTKVVDGLRAPGGRVDRRANPGARDPADPADTAADEAKHGVPVSAEDGNGVATTDADRDRSQNGPAASDAATADADADSVRATKADREGKAPKGRGATPATPTEPPDQPGGGSSHAGGSAKPGDCAACPESKP
jgi:hypothetical protein